MAVAKGKKRARGLQNAENEPSGMSPTKKAKKSQEIKQASTKKTSAGTAESVKSKKLMPKSGKFSKLKTEGKPQPAKLSTKETQAKRKKLRDERRKRESDLYEPINEMKIIWEELRQHDLPKDRRNELCDKVMDLVRGKERDFVFAHDTTRVLQSVCKYASSNVITELFKTLESSLLEMVRSKHSVHLVRSLLRHGATNERNCIIDCLMANSRKLIGNKIAGPVVEFAYNEYANINQRLTCYLQFYGPLFAILEPGTCQPLEQILKNKPEKKASVLKYLKESLESIVQKEALSFTLVHVLLLQYLTYADHIEKQAMAECLLEHIAHIVHTRDGAKAAMFAVWYSSAKGRKTIIKQIKPYLDTLLKEEYGHRVLLAIFDAVDDTKIVSKLIISTIVEKLDVLVDNNWARHVIIYLLKPRDPSNCNKELREFLSLGDGNPFSKKETEMRQKELRDEFSPAVVDFAVANITKLVSSKQLTLLLGLIAQHASSDRTKLYECLVEIFSHSYHQGGTPHPLDNTPLTFTVNRLLKNEATGMALSEQFVEKLSDEILKSYIKTDAGCYVLTKILAAGKCDDFKKTLSKYSRELKGKDGVNQRTLLTQITTG